MSYPSWYAVEEIDEAFDDTKDFLLPFSLGTWLRMAVIVILTGGFISGVPGLGPSDFDESELNNTTLEDDFDSLRTGDLENIDLQNNTALLVLGVIGGTVLLFSYLSSVFQFIFFRSVDQANPRIRNGFRTHWFDGLKYLIYRSVMAVAWISSIFVPLAALATESITAVLASLAVMTPIWIALYLFSFSVNNYTIPQMSSTDSGFISSTLEGLQNFRAEWKQAGIFLLVKIALGIAVAALSGIINLTALLFIGIPVAIMAVLAYSITPWLAMIPVVLGVLGLMLASLAAAIPLQTYMVQFVLNTYRDFS